MEGWNGGRGSAWSYRQETIGSNVSSSRSGTIVSGSSTAYASSGSHFSTFSMEAVAMRFDSLGVHGEEAEEQETEEEHIRSLVQEFFSAPAPSANCGIRRGVMERWLKELGVVWVLSLEDGAGPSAGVVVYLYAPRWIRALDQIARTICSTSPLFPDRGSVDLPSICDEEGEPVAAEKSLPDRYHFALFIQEAMSKVLAFLDVLVALDPNKTEEFLCMLGVHNALSEASNKILTLFDSPTTVKVQRIKNEMAILLSAYKSKLGEAIRNTMEKTMTKLMEDGDDSSTPQGSSDVHKVTRSVTTYIRFLLSNYSLVDAAICDQYVPHIKNVRPSDSLIIEMLSCLQEKLANISESFPNQGLRFLFLLNNTYFIQESKSLNNLERLVLPVDLNHQIEVHMERYLQVSWAPLLLCLFSSMFLCLGKNYNPLSKFEPEFQKIYTTQKQWKVPNPKLKRRLREVITDKIIPSYTEYIEDNKVTNPKFCPQELKAMLQELFEG